MKDSPKNWIEPLGWLSFEKRSTHRIWRFERSPIEGGIGPSRSLKLKSLQREIRERSEMDSWERERFCYQWMKGTDSCCWERSYRTVRFIMLPIDGGIVPFSRLPVIILNSWEKFRQQHIWFGSKRMVPRRGNTAYKALKLLRFPISEGMVPLNMLLLRFLSKDGEKVC